MKSGKPACGLALLLIAAAGIAQDFARESALIETARERVLWAGPDPWFIPAARLVDTNGAVDIHMFPNPNSYHQLRQSMDRARANPGYCAPFTRALIADVFGEAAGREKAERAADPAPLWQKRISRSAISLRGVVIAATPGLSFETNAPGSLVQIRVERVYHQQYGAVIGPADVVSYITGGGELTIEGVRLCMERSGERRLTLGQRVIISGFPQDPITLPLDTDPVTDVLPITSSENVLLPMSSASTMTRPLAAVEAEILATAGTKRRRNGT